MLNKVNVIRILSYCSDGKTVIWTGFDLFCAKRKYMSKHKPGCRTKISSNGALNLTRCTTYCNASRCNSLREWQSQSEWGKNRNMSYFSETICGLRYLEEFKVAKKFIVVVLCNMHLNVIVILAQTSLFIVCIQNLNVYLVQTCCS